MLRFIEACYAQIDDESRWRREVTEAASDVLGTEPAVMQEFVRGPDGPIDLKVVAAGLPQETIERMNELLSSRDVPEGFNRAFGAFEAAVASDLFGTPSTSAFMESYLAEFDWRDAVAIQAVGDPGPSLLLSASSKARITDPGRRVARLKKLARHFAAAHRLRSHRPVIEAVLDLDGKVHHAEGPARSVAAREVLKGAARTVSRARSQKSVDAVLAWQAVWDGRWTMVDSFERDGRQWLVARKNDGAPPSPHVLLPTERDVVERVARGESLKVIGAELGMPISTVSATLASAMVKLRVDKRSDLVKLVAGIVPDRP
ncbi:MAG TPA: LuxR C-terminal-related transcriptional regulator [Polyangiaceae bacterium]|jgi:DNA-binding NarL/FixJ family response regulator|nr:LuxR C-terminal-related transcriptional regulator [Polyangiaceae bacterium]